MAETREIVFEQIHQIRDYINSPRKHYGLFQNKPMFFQLASSMDVIEDTQLAVNAFSQSEFANDKGELYLGVYGLLQALFVQQDAVTHLCEALSIDEETDKHPRLKEIREIRNDSIGHPTKRGQGKKEPRSYNFITQMTLSKAGFELMSHFSDGRFEHKYIQIPEVISDQRKFISEILDKVIAELEREEREHKEKYRAEKLLDIFPSTMGYFFEKVFESIRSNSIPAWGAVNLEQIKKVILEFREAVGRRDMPFYEFLQDEYELIGYAISRLEEFFRAREGSDKTSVEVPAALIFVYFLSEQVEKLRKYAREIDEDYAE